MDDLFARQPWLTEHACVAGRPPGMLGPTEASLLYYLARDSFKGFGEIIDAGAFLGASSYCLARGMEDNASLDSISGRIHAFDLFEIWLEQGTTEEFMTSQIKQRFGVDTGSNQSTLPIYCTNIGALGRHIKVHIGDITTKQWSGRPIEILFVDICKSKHIYKHVIHMFFRSLIPGLSLVIHQDYHHPLLPYIHVGQERLADYFEIVAIKADDSAVFRLKDRIPDSALMDVANYNFTERQALMLMDAAIERLKGQNRHLRLAKVQLLLQYDRLVEARRLLDCLQEELPVPSDNFENYFNMMALAVFRAEAELSRAPEGFDETAYFEANEDVAEAVREGRFGSALHHWIQFGRREGRPWRRQ